MSNYYKIDPREKNLPKWVQDHINALRGTIRTMQRALEQDIGDSNTFLKSPTHEIDDEALGKSPRIQFNTTSNSPWNNTFQVHVEDKVLKIYAAGTVNIRPTSSNCLEIRMDER